VKSRARRFPNSSKAEYRQLGCRSGLMQELSFSFRPAGPGSALEPVWRDLESRSDCSFFLSWDWIGCWLDEIDARPILVEGRAGDAVVVLGVFCPGAARPFAIRSVRLQETGQAEADSLYIEYNGLLIDRRWAGIGERLCIEALLAEGARRGRAGWDRIVIGAAAEPVVAALRDVQPKPRLEAPIQTSHVDLAAIRAAGGDYLAAISANTRYQIRRARRLYEARGPLTLDVARDGEEAQAYFDALRVLHQATWTARGRPGAFASPFFVRFHRHLIASGLPNDAVELVRISAGGAPVAYLYNFLYRGTVYYYASGIAYEPDNKARPGLLSHAMCIAHHLARGDDCYDFMAGAARYKESLGTPGPAISTIIVERAGIRSMLAGAMRGFRERIRG